MPYTRFASLPSKGPEMRWAAIFPDKMAEITLTHGQCTVTTDPDHPLNYLELQSVAGFMRDTEEELASAVA